MACFGDDSVGRIANPSSGYHVSLGSAPKRVESVINHRDLSKGRFVVVVSGGVRVDPKSLTEKTALVVDKKGALDSRHGASAPRDLPLTRWWWD
jgi:hypothetical protein